MLKFIICVGLTFLIYLIGYNSGTEAGRRITLEFDPQCKQPK